MAKKIIVLLIILAPFSLSAAAAVQGGDPPTAVNGLLDLSGWDFRNSGSLALHGEWQFCWNTFISPDQPLPADNTSLIRLPAHWNDHLHKGKNIGGTGHATYRLTIIFPEDSELLALNLKYINTSYRLYAGDVLVSGAGQIGNSKEASVPAFRQDTAFFIPEPGETVLTLHISNYHLNEGGFWEDIIVGSAESIVRSGRSRLAVEILIISSILLMGMYHIGIHLLRRSDRAALFFGLFSIFISIRALTTGEIFLISIFPDFPWMLLLKIEYLSFYVSVPIFIMYLHELFPADCSIPFKRIIQISALLFMLQVVLTEPLFFNRTLFIYQILTSVVSIYIIFILVRALIRKRTGSLILLTGFLFLFAGFVNDLLHANEIIHTGMILPAGLFFFTFSQAVLILNRSAKDHSTIKMQHDELRLSHDLLKRSRQGTILGLAKLAEYRDEDTGKHLERIREYCRVLATELSQTDEYRGYITTRYIEDIYQSSILHDIGKVGVPDAVLLKAGKLDSSEFETIKKHTLIGGNAIQNIELKIDMKSFLTLGKEIAWYHHEKWDGSGYPYGLSGDSIPLSARITAIADVYDALTSERPYKKAFSHEKACTIISEGRGTHFDPAITDLFLKLESDIRKIRDRLSETEVLSLPESS